MSNTLSWPIAVAGLVLAAGAWAASPNKCVVNGKVTYQQTPCATPEAGKQPTVDELNAAQKKRRDDAALLVPATRTAPEKSAPVVPTATSGFRCDGRQYCSQMTSCAEAKYFLAHCPGAKMDGNKDGVPCERQWCSR
jgi:hypothetical protein